MSVWCIKIVKHLINKKVWDKIQAVTESQDYTTGGLDRNVNRLFQFSIYSRDWTRGHNMRWVICAL